MNAFDRDSELERRQIHEISLNVARRLLDVLERRHQAPPALADEIVVGARTVAEIQREIDGIMTALAPGEMLDLAVLTHVLANHNRALSLVEDLEIKAGARGAAQRPDPERTHAALIATAREIERETRTYDPDPPPLTRPSAPPQASPSRMTPAAFPPAPSARRTQANMPYAAPPANRRPQPAPPHTARPSLPASAAHEPPTGRRRPPHRQPPQPHAASAAPTRRARLRTLAKSPVGVVSLIAGVAIVAASLAGAVSFALSSGDASEHYARVERTAGGKIDGRLSAADTASAGASDVLVVTPPANAAPLSQPYLVVLATRRSTEELDQDFRYFKEAHPELLGRARGRVDTIQSQDGKTWHRLSLIPPRSQEEAAALCTELKAAGLTECWIKPLPLGRDAAR